MKRAHILPFVLALSLICAIAFLSMTYARMTQAERTLEAIYQSELSDACEQLGQLRLALDKLPLTGDAAAQAQLLGEVSRLSCAVRDSLSALPAEPERMSAVLADISALSDQTQAMLAALTRSGSLTPEQLSTLRSALADCTLLSGQLALARQALAEGQQTLYVPGGAATLALEPLSGVQEVPVIGHRAPLGLSGESVTQEEAMTIAAQVVGEGRVQRVAASPGTSGGLPAHGVTVETPDLRLNLEITVQGGQLLWMMPETASFPASLDTETCRKTAAAFLDRLGYATMEQTAWQQYGGLYVASFVPVQDGVLLYPDLVHVQVRMDTGEAVGFEADGYLTWHRARSLPLPTLTSAEAEALVAGEAQVEDVRLSLLRAGEQEVLCHQVTALSEGERYLVFLDAQSGRTVAVQKLIVNESGIQPA